MKGFFPCAATHKKNHFLQTLTGKAIRPKASCSFLPGTSFALPGEVFQYDKNKLMLTLILYLAGVSGFVLMYKSISWFEKI